ncbi:MAG: sensor histidine kinase, partial [Gemmatimonadales bacterium]
ELPQVFAERQGTIDSSVTYLENLAGNYARLSPKLELEACDANDAVRQTIGRLGDTGRAAFRTVLRDDLPRIRTDPLVLRRILENLVGNAVDALEGNPGTVTVETALVGGDGGARVRITVADTGKGMTKTDLEHAFDDFFTTKPGGTGLGLSIVRRLVLDAQGTLRVETEPGMGSRFIVELPGA